MRTLGSLAPHVAGTAQTRCSLLRLDLRDGSSIGITDHNENITYAGVGGSLVYRADTGVELSNIELKVGLEASNYEAQGPFGDLVTLEAVLGRRFIGARARLFQVNWASLGDGHMVILWGKVTSSKPDAGRFTFEIRSAADAYNQTIGKVLAPTCTADFADSECKLTRTEFSTTVTAVTSNFQFTISVAGIPAIPFAYGSADFQSGDLAGLPEIEIFSFNAGTGVIEMFAPFPEPPAVGNAITLYNGCSKLLKSDDAAVPTCLYYANVINFRGFPLVPGSSTYLKYQIPGQSGA